LNDDVRVRVESAVVELAGARARATPDRIARTRRYPLGMRTYARNRGRIPRLLRSPWRSSEGLDWLGARIVGALAGPHWLEHKAALGITTHYLRLRLEFLRDEPLITLAELARPPFGRFRWTVRQSGTRMPSSIADALEPWWEARVREVSHPAPKRARASNARSA